MNEIKTWESRLNGSRDNVDKIDCMESEITELRAALAARATPAQPVPMDGETYEADDGTICKKRKGELLWHAHIYTNDESLDDVAVAKEVVAALNSAPSPSSVGAAIRKLPLPDLPARARLYTSGLGNRQYRRASTMNGPGDPLILKGDATEAMRALLSEAAALAEQVPASEDAKFLNWVKAHRPSWIREWRRQLPAAPSIAQDGLKSEGV